MEESGARVRVSGVSGDACETGISSKKCVGKSILALQSREYDRGAKPRRKEQDPVCADKMGADLGRGLKRFQRWGLS